MPYFLIFTIVLVGSSGMIAQVLILRELLISFYGNELILGIILGNWVLAEGLGVFFTGRFIDRSRDPGRMFIIYNLLFSLFLPVSIYFSRGFKAYFGFSFGQAAGLPMVFLVSLLVVFLPAFIHGGLFGISPRVISLNTRKDPAIVLGRVYAWETIGTVIAGITLTYFLIPYLDSFRIVFMFSIINILACIFLTRITSHPRVRYPLVFVLLCCLSLFFLIKPGYLQEISLKKQWNIGKVLEYRNSVYGNIVVLERQGQITFFYNGIPLINLPHADITSSEEFAHLPLLFHENPKDILVMSAGPGGVINEILKHKVKRVDYTELDPLLIDMLNKYASGLTKEELTDPRVRVIGQDSLFFLKNNQNNYDIILIGLSKPSDLSSNRLFTREFFGLTQKHLNNGGIVGFCLPGSLTYLSRELRDLNYSILNALNKVYAFVRIIPGDLNLYLASDSADILKVQPADISNKLKQGNITTNILLPGYLNYRLDPDRVKWFKDSSFGATSRVNLDLAPFAVFEMLVFWNKQFSDWWALLLEAMGGLRLKYIFAFSILMTLILFYWFKSVRGAGLRSAVTYSMATSGFFGMLISLVLIFSFQVNYGYLYQALGMLISVFMAGIAVGSLLISSRLNRIKNSFKFFSGLEIGMILYSLFLAWFIAQGAAQKALCNYWTYLFLFFGGGLLCGLEFPLAGNLCLIKENNIGKAVGRLYFADLFGSWLAGIFTGVVFLPVLGLTETLLVAVILKLSSLVLLTSMKWGQNYFLRTNRIKK